MAVFTTRIGHRIANTLLEQGAVRETGQCVVGDLEAQTAFCTTAFVDFAFQFGCSFGNAQFKFVMSSPER